MRGQGSCWFLILPSSPDNKFMTNFETLNEKQREELYYKLEAKHSDLKEALRNTRQEPVLGLKDVANIIKKVFDEAEVESLKKEL